MSNFLSSLVSGKYEALSTKESIEPDTVEEGISRVRSRSRWTINFGLLQQSSWRRSPHGCVNQRSLRARLKVDGIQSSVGRGFVAAANFRLIGTKIDFLVEVHRVEEGWLIHLWTSYVGWIRMFLTHKVEQIRKVYPSEIV